MKLFDLIKQKLRENSSSMGFGLIPDARYIAEVKAISIISEVEEEYNNGWIPCNEKQPEIKGAYLVTTKVNDFLRVQIMSYDGKAWIGPINTVDYGNVSNRVFAWQSLPETYKG